MSPGWTVVITLCILVPLALAIGALFSFKAVDGRESARPSPGAGRVPPRSPRASSDIDTA
jgi:hypothetical protein